MDIIEQAEQIAREYQIKTTIVADVSIWKGKGMLQDIALHREWAIVQIIFQLELTALLVSGNVTLEQLLTWLNEAITQVASA
jgi:hypothetical protein